MAINVSFTRLIETLFTFDLQTQGASSIAKPSNA